MSENHLTEENSNQYAQGEKVKSEVEDIEQGYETPTSEEHKIPKVDLSCPPPAPKRWKRLLYGGRKSPTPAVVRIIDEELKLFFQLYTRKFRVLNLPKPDPSANAKKRRTDE